MNDLTGAPDRARLLNSLLLLWLSGTALRFTILAVPPVIPLIHDEMNLSATQVGILTGLPSMLFAIAAVPGSLLIARLGVRTALVLGIAVNAIGGALRGALPDIFWLYAMTIAMGAGVAIMQVTMPPAVRALAAAPDRTCHRGLHQRPAGRRNRCRSRSCCRWFCRWSAALAAGLRLLERAGRDHRPARPAVRTATGHDKRIAGAPALVAGLEQFTDLAARHHARHHQCDLFRHQCLHSRLSEEQRRGRVDQRGALSAEYRADSRLVHFACRCRPSRTGRLALYRVRRWFALPQRAESFSAAASGSWRPRRCKASPLRRSSFLSLRCRHSSVLRMTCIA